MKSVVKGIVYYDKNMDAILIPKYTGNFYLVDCDKFINIEDFKANYNEDMLEDVEQIEYNGKKYCYTGVHPQYIENWKIIEL